MPEEQLPYWFDAPEELRAKYPKALDAIRKKLEKKDGAVDWNAVNTKIIAWWKEQGYRYP